MKSAKKQLGEIVIESDTAKGKAFDIIIQVLILLSIISYSVSTLPNLDTSLEVFLTKQEVVFITIFTIEYLLRIWLTKPAKNYAFSVFGIIDLLAILPFYLTMSVDLRTIRAIRLLRVFRIMKLVRYNRAAKRFRTAFVEVKEELILFSAASVVIMYIAGVGIYQFEKAAQPEVFQSVFDGLWWSLATLTTVGYGDIYPITAGGKFFALIVIIIGLGIIAVPTGLFASALSKTKNTE